MLIEAIHCVIHEKSFPIATLLISSLFSCCLSSWWWRTLNFQYRAFRYQAQVKSMSCKKRQKLEVQPCVGQRFCWLAPAPWEARSQSFWSRLLMRALTLPLDKASRYTHLQSAPLTKQSNLRISHFHHRAELALCEKHFSLMEAFGLTPWSMFR